MAEEQRPRRKPRNRGKPKEGEAKGRPRSSRNKKKPSQPARVENSQRYLQICKLFRQYKPFVVNGIPTGKIADAVKAREGEGEASSVASAKSPTADVTSSGDAGSAESSTTPAKKVMNTRDKQKYLKQYLLEFMTRQPDAPIRVSFAIIPSEPDFPFDLESLSVCLVVPAQYPFDEKDLPYLVVLNEDIPRGFALNVEEGFKRICRVSIQNKEDEEIVIESKKSLVAQVEALDKYLELFLKLEERPTVKIVRQKNAKKNKELTPDPKTPQPNELAQSVPETGPDGYEPSPKLSTFVDRDVANLRNAMIADLMSRIGTQTKLFKRTAAEDRFKITLPVYRNALIPELWSKNRKLELMVSVPADYPKTGLYFLFPNNFNTNLILKYKKNDEQLTLVEHTREYKQIEKNFVANASRSLFGGNVDLVGRINWVANNLGTLAMSREENESWKEMLEKLSKVIMV